MAEEPQQYSDLPQSAPSTPRKGKGASRQGQSSQQYSDLPSTPATPKIDVNSLPGVRAPIPPGLEPYNYTSPSGVRSYRTPENIQKDKEFRAEWDRQENEIENQSSGRRAFEIAKQIPAIGPHLDTGEKTVKSFKKGSISQGLGYAGATLLPVVGPSAAGIGEKVGEKDYLGAAEDTAATAAPFMFFYAGDKAAPPNTNSSRSAVKTTNPNQEKAFNALHPENAVSEKSILPEVRNAAAQEAQANPANPIRAKLGLQEPQLSIPKGKAGVQKIADVTQRAIDAHEAIVQQIKTPYVDQPVDMSPAAAAARAKITPEMRQAAQVNPSGPEARSIAQIEDIARQNDGQMKMSDVDARRHRLNDELSSEMRKSDAAQDVSPVVTQAKRSAANALRQQYYDKLSDLSGQDVRSLAQREGQLIEAKAGVTRTGEGALKAKANDTGPSPRVTALKKTAQSVSLTKPASLVNALPRAIQDILNPERNTPTSQYVDRVKRALSQLVAPENPPPLSLPNPPVSPTQPGLFPSELGPLFQVEQTPHTQPGSAPAIPFGEASLLEPGKGRVASSHPSPYESGQPVAAHVTPAQRNTMDRHGFKVDDGTVQDYGQTRRKLVTEEHPEITLHSTLPPEVESILNGTAQKQLPPPSAIQLPSSKGEQLLNLRKSIPESMGGSRISGHNSINGGSLEEGARGGVLKVNAKSATTSYSHRNIDIGNSEAAFRQKPDGSLELVGDNSGVGSHDLMQKFGPRLAETFGKVENGQVELIHNATGQHGRIPLNRAGDYLGSGDYRLAPRK